jgi:hypothetical protein
VLCAEATAGSASAAAHTEMSSLFIAVSFGFPLRGPGAANRTRRVEECSEDATKEARVTTTCNESLQGGTETELSCSRSRPAAMTSNSGGTRSLGLVSTEPGLRDQRWSRCASSCDLQCGFHGNLTAPNTFSFAISALTGGERSTLRSMKKPPRLSAEWPSVRGPNLQTSPRPF